MKNFIKKLKDYKFIFSILSSFFIGLVVGLWTIFNLYIEFTHKLEVIQKSTLRNTIWNENIPMHDRIESCDSYIASNYNSETKKYCNKLLERDDENEYYNNY